MKNMTTVIGAPALSAAPLFRVSGGIAVSSCRPVSGSAQALDLRVSDLRISGLRLSGLRGYAGQTGPAAPAGLPVLVHERRPEQGRLVQQGQQVFGGRGVILAQVDGSDSGTNGLNGTTSTTGTKPMSPWDLRTSSPPG